MADYRVLNWNYDTACQVEIALSQYVLDIRSRQWERCVIKIKEIKEKEVIFWPPSIICEAKVRAHIYMWAFFFYCTLKRDPLENQQALTLLVAHG